MYPRPMTEIEIAEAQAVASPRDWPQDYRQPHGWQVCIECNRPFLGIHQRIQCRSCCGKEIQCSPS